MWQQVIPTQVTLCPWDGEPTPQTTDHHPSVHTAQHPSLSQQQHLMPPGKQSTFSVDFHLSAHVQISKSRDIPTENSPKVSFDDRIKTELGRGPDVPRVGIGSYREPR